MPISTDSYLEGARTLAESRRVLLVSHERADGDALGSLIALQSMLRSIGVEAVAVRFDPVPPKYALLDEVATLPSWPEDVGPDNVGELDAIVIVDTCSYGQLECFADFLRGSPAKKVVVDHHVTRDELADLYLIDEHASSTCILLAEWAAAVGWNIDEAAKLGLFVGMATDTGWFRFSNTDVRTLTAAAKLIDAGIEPAEIHQRLFSSDSAGRIRLLGAMLGTLELHADGRVATVEITREMLAACGVTRDETEDLVNEPQRIGSVVAVALFSEPEEEGQKVKVSLRSKRDVNVAAIAATFGGGGHERAAGLRVPGSLPDIKAQVTAALVNALD